MTRGSKRNVDLVGRAARLIRERTARGEPVWWCGTTGPSLCRVFPSDEKMVRRHMRAEKPWRDDEDFFLHVGAELGAEHRDRGRLIVLDQRTHKQRAEEVRARRERNKQRLAAWRELEADQNAMEAFFQIGDDEEHVASFQRFREAVYEPLKKALALSDLYVRGKSNLTAQEAEVAVESLSTAINIIDQNHPNALLLTVHTANLLNATQKHRRHTTKKDDK